MKWPGIWQRFSGRKIQIYADFIDPFCYIGFHNVRRVAEATGITLEWHGFELNPQTPPKGSLLQTANNSDLRFGMWTSVAEFAKKSGLTLAEPTKVPNTRMAQAWVHRDMKPDVKNSLIERIYQAYLSDQKDIGDPSILAALAAEIGIPEKSGLGYALNGNNTILERCRKEALQHQFPGMPGFVFKGKTYFGALSEKAWNDITKESL